MKDKIKEKINIPENVLVALSDLTNGALNYYKATETVKVRHNTILDYITNLQEKLKMVERDNKIYKLRHNNAIKKLSSAINHYNLEDKNNTILFVKEILEGNDISEKSYRKLNGGDDNE